MIERLTLEETLLRHTRDNWILVGRHSVWPPQPTIVIPRDNHNVEAAANDAHYQRKILPKTLPKYIANEPNPRSMVVMGISGKAERLLNIRNVVDDQLLVVKRFSGGGTVVMDENAIWTTLIAGRKEETQEQQEQQLCKPYPREIMKWTADAIFEPTFGILNANAAAATSQVLPEFSLREDDYVLTMDTKTRKMGGNAQAIVGKQGWLHHTSFLWDYEDINMERYLKLPEKRPDYRRDRSHKDFLVKLKDYYGERGEEPSVFVEAMKEACLQNPSLRIEQTDWSIVYKEVFQNSKATMNSYWLGNNTKLDHSL